jgi:putative flippase GtrA
VCPSPASNHGRNRLDPPKANQREYSFIDSAVQTKIVDANTDAAPTAMLARSIMIRHRSPTLLRPTDGQHGRIGWFVVVGCAAAAVHWGVATGMVAFAHWSPLRSNVAGWLIALMVSFTGHHQLSFRGHGTSLGSAGWRFLCISGGGFFINEIAYALLLRWTAVRYDVLLACVLISVAGATYVLSRHWAFLRSPEH